VAASSAAPLLTVAFPASLASPHVLRLRLTGPRGQLLSENVYWRYRSAQDLQALNHLPQVTVSAGVRGTGRGGLAVALRNEGHAVAAMVVLSLRDRRSGQRILPTYYSDNYLWLLPGETRDVTLSWPDRRPPFVPRSWSTATIFPGRPGVPREGQPVWVDVRECRAGRLRW
jgi:hypothetical protein